MKTSKKIVAIIMTLLTLMSICSVAMPIFAQEIVFSDDDFIDEIVETEEEPYILSEDLTKREENVKHFLMSDGSYLAAQYDEPVHYENDNGEWIDYDNNLTKSEATETQEEIFGQSTVYKTNNENSNIVFAEKSNSNTLVLIEDKEYSISWNYQSAKNSRIKVIENNEVLEGDDAFLTLDHIEKEVLYENFFSNIDLQYIVKPSGSKENIILKNKEAQNSFTVSYNIGDLTANVVDEKTIELTDGEIVHYIISAPYMYDANGEISEDLTMTVTKNKNGKLKIELAADREWLDDENRAYPVVIDPSVSGTTNSESTGVAISVSNFTSTGNTSSNLAVGYSSSFGKSAIKVNTTFDPDDFSRRLDFITSAYLNFTVATNPSSNMYIYAYQAKSGTPSWSDISNAYLDTVIDYRQVTTTSTSCQFDITNIFKDWYENSSSKSGIILASFDNTTSGSPCCYFYKNASTPTLLVEYRTEIGLEDYWSYSSFDCGNAGTANVNNHSGNLAFTYQDNSSFDVAFTYNSMSDVNTVFPYAPAKSSSSLTQFIKSTKTSTLSCNLSAEAPYVYVDEDGTEHYFSTVTSAGVTSNSHDAILSLGSETNTYKLTTTDSENGDNYKIFTIKDGVAVITKEGYVDKDGVNTVYYTYNNTSSASGVVDLLIDDSGNKLSYKISESGTSKRVTFYENGEFVKRYTYSDGYLTSVLFNDGSIAEYQYDYYYGKMSAATSDSGYKLLFTYHGNKQVDAVAETTNNDNITGQVIEFNYSTTNKTDVIALGEDGTSLTDDIHTTYLFNNNGQLTNANSKRRATSEELGAVAYGYEEGSSKPGSISRAAALGKITENLILNHNLESTSNWTSYLLDDKDCVCTADFTEEEAHSGDGSLKIDVDSITKTGGASYYQAFNINNGKIVLGQTYTASAYIKTDDIVRQSVADSSRDYGASVMVRIHKSDGTSTRTYSENIKISDESVDNGWKRVFTTFTVPADATKVTVHLFLRNASGTAYFDDVQLEVGDVPTEYNLLENNGFIYSDSSGYATSWTRYNLSSTDMVSEGKMKMVGSPAVKKGVYQEVALADATQEDTYTIGGWASGGSVPASSGRVFGIYPIVYYDDNSDMKESKEIIYFNSYYDGSQFTGGSFSLSSETYPSATPTKIRLLVCFYREENTAYFDRVSLVKSHNVYDFTEEEVSNEETETAGDGSYKYNNGIIESYTDETGVVYNYTYDAYGNVISVLNSQDNGDRYAYYEVDSDGDGIKDKFYIKSETYEDGTSYSYTYHSNWEVKTETVTENGITTVSEYNSDGILIKETITENGTQTVYNYTYDSKNNLLTKKKNGMIVEQYEYSYPDFNFDGTSDSTLVTYEKLEDGTENTYTYYSQTSVLSSLVSSKGGSTVTYNYNEDGTVSSVNHNGFTYYYSYDAFGNVTDVKVGTQSLAAKTYSNVSKAQTSTVYGNGASESYSYNLYGELTEKTLSNGGSFSWKYDSLGNLIYEKDNVNSQKTYYHYDEKGRFYGEKVNSTVNSNAYANELYSDMNTLDDEGNVTKNSLSAGGDSYSTSYSYHENGNAVSTTISSSRKINYTFDDYKLIARTTTTTTPINETFIYGDNGNVTQHVIGSDTYGYAYDDNGNITQITKNGVVRQSYVYDANNQLIRENDLDANKTIIYTYDNGGNITNRKEYAYTTGTVGTATDTISYAYDSTWKDKLTSYDGQSITYDVIGNPVNYMGATIDWFGRQMQSYSKGNTSITYKYDSDGLRTQKVVNGIQYDYYYVDGQLRYEKKGDEYEIIYRYNNDGTLASVTRNRFSDGKTDILYAVTNTRGDVIELRSGSGAVNTVYTYDSWGKIISITNASGTALASTNLGVQNSIRYRGYVYDTETGLYYLKSRYYDPETGRFLNADDVDFIGASGTVLSYNAFAYCENNAIGNADYSGNNGLSILVALKPILNKLLPIFAMSNFAVENSSISNLIKSMQNIHQVVHYDFKYGLYTLNTVAETRKITYYEKYSIITYSAKKQDWKTMIKIVESECEKKPSIKSKISSLILGGLSFNKKFQYIGYITYAAEVIGLAVDVFMMIASKDTVPIIKKHLKKISDDEYYTFNWYIKYEYGNIYDVNITNVYDPYSTLAHYLGVNGL